MPKSTTIDTVDPVLALSTKPANHMPSVDLDADLPIMLAGLTWDSGAVKLGDEDIPDQAPVEDLDPTKSGLVRFLYEDRYSGHSAALPRVPSHPDRLSVERFLSGLESANPSKGIREPGWKFVNRQDEHFLVQNGDKRIAVHYRNYDERTEELVHDRHSRLLQPGWFYVFGDVKGNPTDPLMRVYWNISAEGAAMFVHEIAKALNRDGVHFRLKLVQEPQQMRRADGAVLYIPLHSWEQSLNAIQEVQSKVNNFLRPSRPLFTSTFMRGVAIAIDHNFQSNGMIFSAAVVRAIHDAKSVEVDRVMACLKLILREQGVDLGTTELTTPGATS